MTTIHEPELLETGGGLRNALPLLGPGPVLTLNSDAVWRGENPVAALLQPLAAGPDGGAGLDLAGAARPCRGAAISSPMPRVGCGAARAWSISARRSSTRRGWPMVPEAVFSLNRVWDGMIAAGTLFGLTYAGRWCDVGQPGSIPLAEAMLGDADG